MSFIIKCLDNRRLTYGHPKSSFILLQFNAFVLLLFSTMTCNGKDDPSDHKFEVEFVGDAEIDVWGSYVISGTQITFNDEGGAYSSDEAGVYEFVVSDTTLKLTIVLDPVYGRSMLVEGSWSKNENVNLHHKLALEKIIHINLPVP